jgi:hypothetical protein
MNTKTPLTLSGPNIRVVTNTTELPDEPRSFNYTGDAEALAAFLADDSKQWDCIEYIAHLDPESTNLWSVWRR